MCFYSYTPASPAIASRDRQRPIPITHNALAAPAAAVPFPIAPNYLGINLNIRVGISIWNMVTNVYAKSNYNRLRINKALGTFFQKNW